MKLVERMPRVCKTVIKAKGSYFEESQKIKYIMDTYHAAHWSDLSYSSSEEEEEIRYSHVLYTTRTLSQHN